jgi:hypothetical protein
MLHQIGYPIGLFDGAFRLKLLEYGLNIQYGCAVNGIQITNSCGSPDAISSLQVFLLGSAWVST